MRARHCARSSCHSDAHLVCAPPKALVSDCTPYVLDPTLDARKLLAPLASLLDCFKYALAGLLLGFFAFG